MINTLTAVDFVAGKTPPADSASVASAGGDFYY